MIIYFRQADEPAGSLIGLPDNEHDWWAGTQKCGAAVAIAATMALAAQTMQAAAMVSLHQDDPAGVLRGQPDEDLWQNPQMPSPPAAGKTWLPDPEEIPAAALRGQPDEDAYTLLFVPRATPAPAILFGDDDVTVPQAAAFTPEEEPWLLLRPQAMAPATKLFSEDDVMVPQSVSFTPDEDLSNLATAPAQAKSAVLYLPDAEEIPAAALRGQPDEDFYTLWIPPVVQPLAKVLTDDDVIVPQGGAALTPDEDFWQFLRPLAFATPPKLFLEDDIVTTTAAPAIVDEDYRMALPIWTSSAPVIPFAADETIAAPAAILADDSFRLAPPRVPSAIAIYFLEDGPFVLSATLPGPFVGVERGFATFSSLAASQAKTLNSLGASANAATQSLAAGQAATFSGMAAKGCATFSSLAASGFAIIVKEW